MDAGVILPAMVMVVIRDVDDQQGVAAAFGVPHHARCPGTRTATDEKEAHLKHLSAKRKATPGMDIDARQRDARELFARPGVEMLHVRRTASGTSMVDGVLTRCAVDAYTETPSRRAHS